MARTRTSTYTLSALMGLLCARGSNPQRSLLLQERPVQVTGETTIPTAGRIAGEVDSEAPAAGAEDQTICRTEVVTGTHRPRTVCLTRAERRATRDAAQDWYRSGGRDGAVSQIPGVR